MPDPREETSSLLFPASNLLSPLTGCLLPTHVTWYKFPDSKRESKTRVVSPGSDSFCFIRPYVRCMHTHIRTHTHTHTHTHAHTHKYTHLRTHIRAGARARTHTHAQTQGKEVIVGQRLDHVPRVPAKCTRTSRRRLTRISKSRTKNNSTKP